MKNLSRSDQLLSYSYGVCTCCKKHRQSAFRFRTHNMSFLLGLVSFHWKIFHGCVFSALVYFDSTPNEKEHKYVSSRRSIDIGTLCTPHIYTLHQTILTFTWLVIRGNVIFRWNGEPIQWHINIQYIHSRRINNLFRLSQNMQSNTPLDYPFRGVKKIYINK